ncbi:MAG: group 1 truncated hemoglobin [Mariprofundaceae bacterium]|nr:group 1 truncated hemoglobin [Mariprofundaceae bacterium]
MSSLFEQIGGQASVNAAIDPFYRRVLGDPYVSRFFENVDMVKQAEKQRTFLTLAFGGPNHYAGMDMRAGHKDLVEKMGLNDTHFEHILAHLRSTLAELGLKDDMIAQVVTIAESTRADVLNK